MNPLIKWPGGKSGEIKRIEKIIPTYDRYIEPFFGGGALFFHLMPKEALINDISTSLMEYYQLIKDQDKLFYDLLLCYDHSFSNLISICDANYPDIYDLFKQLQTGMLDKDSLRYYVEELVNSLSEEINSGFSEMLVISQKDFSTQIVKTVVDKMVRTVANFSKQPFSNDDLKENLITGFTSGYYTYFRKVFNDIHLNRIQQPSKQYKAANFYFIREYCYGSMFRYNSQGEFNIPYGGMSYNKKNFLAKIENMFNEEVEAVFKNTDIFCLDFEEFFKKANLTKGDFMFLDPPYDTDFSDYEGKDFTKDDQERLASCLRKTSAQFILIIKNTDFIYDLYEDHFNIVPFDNQYTYNVRSRNERNVEHLIITNLPV